MSTTIALEKQPRTLPIKMTNGDLNSCPVVPFTGVVANRIDVTPLQIATLILPLVGMILALILVFFTNVDLLVSQWCFDPSQTEPWRWSQFWLWALFKEWGHLPGIMIGIAGCFPIVISALMRRRIPGFHAGIFLVVTILLGPLLLVNSVLKENWQRPRPREITQFGGTETFSSFATPGLATDSKSFPSGHASIAWYLMIPGFIYLRRGRMSAGWWWMGVGLLYGTLMGASRIAQGAHFLSDVIGSAVIIYSCGLAFYWILRWEHLERWSDYREKQRYTIVGAPFLAGNRAA